MKRYSAVLTMLVSLLFAHAMPFSTVFLGDAHARCPKFRNVGGSTFRFVSSGRISVTESDQLDIMPPGFATVDFEFTEQEGAFFSGFRFDDRFVCAFKDRKNAVCVQSKDQTIFELRVRKVKRCAVTRFELFAFESFHPSSESDLRAFVAKAIGDRLPD